MIRDNALHWPEEWNDEIVRPERTAALQSQVRWDAIAKPLDGLGHFEHIITRIAAMTGDADVRILPASVIVMCADNGIVEEGVSQSGPEVTAAVAESMAKRRSSVCKMAQKTGAEVIPVDIGIVKDMSGTGLIHAKVRNGTRNFLKEPALTEAETLQALQIGIDLARQQKEKGCRLLLTGEMGIGNTTTSAAVTAALLGLDAEEVCGRGAGLDDAGLARKIAVIDEGLRKYGFRQDTDRNQEKAFRALCCFGGLDIAGLAGLCIGGALYRIPVVIDGVIAAAAALAAVRLVPGCRDYLIASHAGREKACTRILQELCLTPVIYGDMALGEGTGAVMLVPLLQMALAVYHDNTPFSELQMAPYERYADGCGEPPRVSSAASDGSNTGSVCAAGEKQS